MTADDGTGSVVDAWTGTEAVGTQGGARPAALPAKTQPSPWTAAFEGDPKPS